MSLLSRYDPGGFFCDVESPRRASPATVERLVARLDAMPVAELRRRAHDAERELYNLGITFTLSSKGEQVDRILPFDVIPRLISADDWTRIEHGVRQRVQAINLFLHDVYHDARILKDGIVPADLVRGNRNYRPEMEGIDVPLGIYTHIVGIDLVRGGDGRFVVLEDNARVPSGVSYVVENRHLTQRAFPDLVANLPYRSVSNYGQRLAETLMEIAPQPSEQVEVVLLSPGTYNSAYFEHVFLAREMGVPLVEGGDLAVEDDRVYMRTVAGLSPVDVIYRRLGDDFLDPEVFRPDSLLGVPGLMRAYRRGRVALANAVGTGVADDKAVYAYVPRIIRYYLDQDPILDNVETHMCREPEALAYTLAHLDELVVKPVGEAGGYGIVVGPLASRRELERCRANLQADPGAYVSQPLVDLSVCPTLCRGGIEPRHVDLRPFAVTGRATWVLPGGLTRVALRRGSFVVNSSQGGGSKDTLVLE